MAAAAGKPKKRRSKGTGSVKKRTDRGVDMYRARYRDARGRDRSKSFKRKEDAERWLRKQLTAKDAGTELDPRNVTYEQLTELWRETWVNLKPSTRKRYEGILRKHLVPEFGPLPVQKLRHEDVQRFINKLNRTNLTPGTVLRIYQVLRTSLRYAVRRRFIAQPPTEDIRLPEVIEREMAYLNAEQVAAVAEAVPGRYRALIYTAAFTGLRFGELAGLKLRRVNLLQGYVDVVETLTDVDGEMVTGSTKSRKKRRVSLPLFLRDMLMEHIAEYVDEPANIEAYVFTSAHGNPLRAAGFNKPWKTAVRKALPSELQHLRFHDLRHTCVSLLISQGAHPKAISDRLGHASISITMDRYGHLLQDVNDDLVAGLDATFRATRPDEDSPEEAAG